MGTVQQSLCVLILPMMCCYSGFPLFSTACALFVIRRSHHMDAKVNQNEDKKTGTNAFTLSPVLDRDLRIVDGPLGVRGAKSERAGRIPAPTAATSLRGLLALAVIDTLKARSSPSVSLFGVSGERSGVLFLHTFPW